MTEIQLSEQDRAFVDEQVQAGIYTSASEVVAAGLRLLGSNEGKLAELQRLIQQGIDDVEAGRVNRYDSAADMLSDIKSMTAERRTEKRY